MSSPQRKAVDLAIPKEVAFRKEKKRMTYEERQIARELEEKRKRGEAPAETDEEGKEINPHIPKFISEAPWYLTTGRSSLKHQRMQKEKAESKSFGMKKWYARGKKKGPAATKYRKGACENCGAMSHNTKDCMERPRKVGAKHNGKDIAADEIVENQRDLGFEGNRDRWNGYDPGMYKVVMAKYNARDEARRELEMEEKKKKLAAGEVESDDDGSSSGDFDPDAFSKADPKTRTTVRNLRLREDRAKYLHNLEMNSAYYDPKSRSMRQNPYDGKDESEATFVGDNWEKETGDTAAFQNMHRAAWDLAEKGDAPNLFASPSEAAQMHKEMNNIAEQRKSETKKKLLEQYGGQEFASTPSSSFLRGQSEVYTEYAPDGSIIKQGNAGESTTIPKSKYAEDIYPNNHSSVWGSWYREGDWGFACCHQTSKASFCPGYIPIEIESTVPSAVSAANKNDDGGNYDSDSVSSSSSDSERKRKRRKRRKENSKKKRRKKREKHKKDRKRRRDSDSEESEDGKKSKAKKIKYSGSKVDHLRAPSEAEMEEYKANKTHWNDPMHKMNKL